MWSKSWFCWYNLVEKSLNHITFPRDGENQKDFVIILDESGSVTSPNFDIMKEFVKFFIDALPLENNGARLAVITYSTGKFEK